MALVYSIDKIFQLLSSSEDEDLDNLTNNSQTLTKYKKAHKNETQILFPEKFAFNFATKDLKLVNLEFRPITLVDSESEDNRSSDECNEHEDRIAKDHWKTVTVGRKESIKTKVDKNNKSDLKENKICNKIKKNRPQVNLVDDNRESEDNHEEANLKCLTCKQLLKNEQIFMLHMQIHDNRKETECVLCDENFESVDAVLDHYASFDKIKDDQHFIKLRPFPCHLCDMRYKNRKHLTDHLDVHAGQGKYLCPICGKKFNLSAQLKLHEITNQCCESCNKCFRTLRDYQAHQRNIHGMNIHESNFTCPICNRAFSRGYNMKSHMETHHIYRCVVCNINFEFRTDYQRHRRKFHKNYICSICGRLFLLNCELRTHMEIHSRVKDICILCDKEFRNNRDYKAHMRNIHGTTDDKNICSICGKSFLQHWKLKRHMETHSNSKEFRYNRDYKEHMRHINETTDKKIDIDLKKALNKTLNEEKNAANSISRETLRRKQFKIMQNVQESQPATIDCIEKKDDDIKINIKTDQRNIHGENNFTCPICNRAFTRRKNMKSHMETHDRIYRCVVCNTNFEIRIDFNRHMREVHNNYTCSMCGKLFFQQSKLTSHMKTHSRMEMCTLCDKEFLNNRDYKEHMKNIHGKKN